MKSVEVCEILPHSSAEPEPHLCSSLICLQVHDGHPAPRLPSAMLTATRRIFPLAHSFSALDTDTSNQLVYFNAAAEKSLILTDLYLDSLSSIYLFILRISVYLLDRAPSSPTEATIEP